MALTDKLTAIADAIRAKNGTAGKMTLEEMPDKIAAIQTGVQTGGGSSVSPKDVNFYDYDGTLVASYSLSEARSLTALPDGPAHSGLTFQGWNYTLEKVKALTLNMNVGATYITDDGKTRLYIRIAEEGRMNVPLYISQTVADGVTIDWGDGSATETLAGTGNVNTTHTYASIGNYVITLDPADGCELGFAGSSSYCVLGSTGDSGKVYCNMLQSVQIGNVVTSIGSDSFNSCYSLARITIPNSVTSIGAAAFSGCYSLASITIPNSVTSIGNYAFQNCYSLASITIPGGVTSIGDSAFDSCYSLASITIPKGVISIGSYAFVNCDSLASITIPYSVTGIGDRAFAYCVSLASINIPGRMTIINKYVFFNCFSLASIIIPDSVSSIGDGAFNTCYGMAEYHLNPTTPPRLSSTGVFSSIPSDCIIYVPKGCLEAYQNATNWATYASKMQEEPA